MAQNLPNILVDRYFFNVVKNSDGLTCGSILSAEFLLF